MYLANVDFPELEGPKTIPNLVFFVMKALKISISEVLIVKHLFSEI
jgi:hypothetical protein